MGFVNIDLRVRYEDVDKNNHLTARGFLKYLLEAATRHSNMAGYGLDNVPETHIAWVVLNWKLQIYKYPKTEDTLHIRTWVRFDKNIYSIRDYEVLDSVGNRIAIGSSKWVPIDTETRKIVKISDEIVDDYGPVDFKIFDNDFSKLSEPKEEYSNSYVYTIMRRDLDTNKHVNNLNYIDFALEALPNDVYENTLFQEVEIMYKKQCLYGDKIKCLYLKSENGEHIVTIKSEDLSVLHAIVKFKE